MIHLDMLRLTESGLAKSLKEVQMTRKTVVSALYSIHMGPESAERKREWTRDYLFIERRRGSILSFQPDQQPKPYRMGVLLEIFP
jgi:hypothetical protein